MCAGLWEGVWASGDAHLCPVHGKYLNMGLGLSDADTNKLSIYSWNLCSWACVVQTYTGRLLPGVINLWVRQTAEVLGVHLVGTIRVSCAGSLLVLSHTYCHTLFLPLLKLHCFLSACVELCSLETVLHWRLRSFLKWFVAEIHPLCA